MGKIYLMNSLFFLGIMPKSPLTKLPNIWPVIADYLIKIWIATPEEFLAKDPYEIFFELKKMDPTLCRCALSSIIGASKGEKWNLVRKEAVETFEKKYPKEEWKCAWKWC